MDISPVALRRAFPDVALDTETALLESELGKSKSYQWVKNEADGCLSVNLALPGVGSMTLMPATSSTTGMQSWFDFRPTRGANASLVPMFRMRVVAKGLDGNFVDINVRAFTIDALVSKVTIALRELRE